MPSVGDSCIIPCLGTVKVTYLGEHGVMDAVAECGRSFQMTAEMWDTLKDHDPTHDDELFLVSWNEGDCPRFGRRVAVGT